MSKKPEDKKLISGDKEEHKGSKPSG